MTTLLAWLVSAAEAQGVRGRSQREGGTQPGHHTHYHTVLAHVNVRADLSCVDHTIFLNEDMVPDM